MSRGTQPVCEPGVYVITCLVKAAEKRYIYGVCYLNGDGTEEKLIADAGRHFGPCSVTQVRAWPGGTCLGQAVKLHEEELEK